MRPTFGLLACSQNLSFCVQFAVLEGIFAVSKSKNLVLAGKLCTTSANSATSAKSANSAKLTETRAGQTAPIVYSVRSLLFYSIDQESRGCSSDPFFLVKRSLRHEDLATSLSVRFTEFRYWF